MSVFENYAREAGELEREFMRLGIALGIDWEDPVAVRLLAREALACKPAETEGRRSPLELARLKLFGLANVMLKVMAGSAVEDMQTHGGPVWKAFARALWAEAECQGRVAARGAPSPE